MKIAFLGIFLMSSACFAVDSSSGCGVGWMIAPKQSIVSSATRAVVNVMFSNSIAMTLGTSGCAQHSIVKNESKGMHYAEANFLPLMMEIPAAAGQFVNGFASVLGCSDAQLLHRNLKKNFSKLIESDGMNPDFFYQNVVNEIKNNRELADNCHLI